MNGHLMYRNANQPKEGNFDIIMFICMAFLIFVQVLLISLRAKALYPRLRKTMILEKEIIGVMAKKVNDDDIAEEVESYM